MTRKRNHLIWIGLTTAFVGFVSYFLVFARFPLLRDFPWVNLPLVVAGAALSALAVLRAWREPRVYRGKVLGVIGLALSLILALGLATYVFWLSYQLPEPTEKTLGLVEAPDFALASAAGGEVRLSDYRGRKVVLVFYRGFW